MSGNTAVEYQAAHQGGPVQALLPLNLLNACEGSKPDPVQLDFSVPDKVAASWTDKHVPVMLDFDVSAPDDTLPPFPPLPTSFATNEPDLWTALREASASTDPNPTRAAVGCIRVRGGEGKLIATDGRQLLVQSGFTFPWTEQELLVPASNVFGCRELPSDQPVYVGKTEDWATFRIGLWSILLKLGRLRNVVSGIRLERRDRPVDKLHQLAALPRVEQLHPQGETVTGGTAGRCFVRPRVFRVRTVAGLGGSNVLQGIGQVLNAGYPPVQVLRAAKP